MIKLSEKVILGLIIMTLALPIPCTLLVHRLKNYVSPQFDWIANRTLSGVSTKKGAATAQCYKLAQWRFAEGSKCLN